MIKAFTFFYLDLTSTFISQPNEMKQNYSPL